MAISLTEDQMGAIRRHAARTYPFECCGFLVGRTEGGEKVVGALWPVENVREEEAQRRRYLIDPRSVLESEQRARREEVDILGVYHSHPDHPAEPSEFDREHAWPFFSYIIVEVRSGEPKSSRSWTLSEDRSRFLSEEIRVGRRKEQS
jgi:proteasome lid subunit RPN8/RPN11